MPPSIVAEVMPAGLVLRENEEVDEDMTTYEGSRVRVLVAAARTPPVRFQALETITPMHDGPCMVCAAECLQREMDRSQGATPDADADADTERTDGAWSVCAQQGASSCEADHIFGQPLRWEDTDHVVLGQPVVSPQARDYLLRYFHVRPYDQEPRVTLPDCDTEDCLPHCVVAATPTR